MHKISQRGIDLIKKFEGFSDVAYLCPAGVWTIGYGSTKNVEPGQYISEEDAEKLLIDGLKVYEDAVNKYVKVDISQAVFDAFVSFCYNVGVHSFRYSTLLRKFNTHKFGDGEEFLRWNKARVNGQLVELPGLTARRKAERDLFLYG